MQPFADYHTHTLYSDGHGTLEENVMAAVSKNFTEIGITDHGPRNIGTGVNASSTYLRIKEEAKLVGQKYPQINIKVGAEADIVNLEGDIDIAKGVAKQLDLLIIGLHPYVLPKGIVGGRWIAENLLSPWSTRLKQKTLNDNTKALVAAIHQHQPDIISHPGLKMSVDIHEVAAACAKCGAAYEINVGHLFQTVEELQTAMQAGTNFVIDSDAHFPQTVAVLEEGIALAEAAGIPVERIINMQEFT